MRFREGPNVSVERELLFWVILEHQYFIRGFGRRQLERLDGPFQDPLYGRGRREQLIVFPVVEHRHFDSMAVVPVNVVPMPDFALAELSMVFERFIDVLQE